MTVKRILHVYLSTLHLFLLKNVGLDQEVLIVQKIVHPGSMEDYAESSVCVFRVIKSKDVKTLQVSTFTTELHLKIFHYLKILFKNKLFHKKYIWTSNSL